MSARRFIAVKFRPGDARSYTYHYDGAEDFAAGDEVKVEDRDGGWKRVTVVGEVEEPAFATKPILGRAPA